MVRGAERACCKQWRLRIEQPGYRMDFCGFEGFIKRKIRENGGESAGEHGFSGTWRADHQHIAPCFTNILYYNEYQCINYIF
jgi:hypothetical protein